MKQFLLLPLLFFVFPNSASSNDVFYDQGTVFHTIAMNDNQLNRYNWGNNYQKTLFTHFNISDTGDKGRALLALTLFSFNKCSVYAPDVFGRTVLSYAEENRNQFPILYKSLISSVIRKDCIAEFKKTKNVKYIYETDFVEAVVYLNDIIPHLLEDLDFKSINDLKEHIDANFFANSCPVHSGSGNTYFNWKK